MNLFLVDSFFFFRTKVNEEICRIIDHSSRDLVLLQQHVKRRTSLHQDS